MSDTITLPKKSKRVKEEEEQKTKRQPPYNVILLNDAPQHHAGMYMASVGDDTMLVGDPHLGRAFVPSISISLLDQIPDGRVETRPPARVELTEPDADARGIGGVDDHAAAGQLGFAGGVDRRDILALQLREMGGVTLHHGPDLARQCLPRCAVRQQREPRPEPDQRRARLRDQRPLRPRVEQ